MRLTDRQIETYSRQIILREVGGTGQAALRRARVRVLGAGPAAEACISYLVGAGIGLVALDAPRRDGAATSTLPFPAPERRTPDAAIIELAADAAPPDDAPDDVLLDLDADADVEAATAAVTASPRLGWILLRAVPPMDLRIVLLPRGIACPACTHAGSPAGTATRPPAIAAASAGAIAALGCCRWLLDIASEVAPRALVLPAGSTVWTEGAPPARQPCPRGCPPPAQPV